MRAGILLPGVCECKRHRGSLFRSRGETSQGVRERCKQIEAKRLLCESLLRSWR